MRNTSGTILKLIALLVPAAALAQPPTISTTSLPDASVGIPYSQTLQVKNGTPPFTWSITAGSLPAGLSLAASTGVIAGTPTAAGTSNFTVQVRDAASRADVQAMQIVVRPALVIMTTSFPAGNVGTPYSQTLGATGGSGGYTWGIASGSLPAGLTLAPDGTVTGTPTAAGTSNFTVRVTDSSGNSITRTFSLTINPQVLAVATGSLPGATINAPYSTTLAASGGTPPYKWSVVSGALPPGVTLAADTGVISGTPTQTGSFAVNFQVTDAANATARATLTLNVVGALTITTAAALPGGSSGVAYSTTLQAAGGATPYSWAITDGALPAGVTLNSNGTIQGTPTAAGAFGFTAEVTDANGLRSNKQFTLTVLGPVAITTAPSLPGGVVGGSYSTTLAGAGGATPYLWSISAGSLPPGLTLDGSSGAITGTPTAGGNFTFTARLTDAGGISVEKQFTLAIGQGLTITTAAGLPNGALGSPYTVTLAAAGGQQPYTWSLTSGALPGGLALNASSGTISGTPSAQGTFNFTIRVTDAANASATRVHTIVIGPPSSSPVFSIVGLPQTTAPLQQPAIDVSLSSPYPNTVTGRITLSFNPTSSNPVDDPSVQFSTGGRTASFTIPANALHATFPTSQFAVQTGSVAGTITLTVDQLQSNSTNLNPPPPVSTQVAAQPPSIRALSVVRTSDGFQVKATALSSTRELTQATVRFIPVSGSPLQTVQTVVQLGDVARAWFSSGAATQFGGQFTLTLPFTFVGGTGGLDSVAVTLSNGAGNSQESSARY